MPWMYSYGLLGLFLSLFFGQMSHGASVSLSESPPLARAGNATGFPAGAILLHTEAATSEEGKTEAAPHQIYIPIAPANSSTVAARANQFLSLVADSPALIPLNSQTGASCNTGDAFVAIDMVLENDTGTTAYMHLAVKSGDTFTPLSSYSGGTSETSGVSQTFRFEFSLSNLCATSGVTCTELADANCTGEFSRDFTVYAFPHTTQIPSSIGTSNNPTDDWTGGIFFSLKFSGKLPDSATSDNHVSLDDLRRGDEKLTAVISNGGLLKEMGTNLLQTIAVNRTAEATSFDFFQTAKDAGGVVVSQNTETAILEGEFSIPDLTNGQSYNISMALVNKWQFSSRLTTSREGTPQPLEAFLEKQACYLLAAGFKQDHMILDVFRWFRDRVMLPTNPGRYLVAAYYVHAPEVAKVIMGSTTLSLLVRIFAYGLFSFIILLPILTLYLGYRIYGSIYGRA